MLIRAIEAGFEGVADEVRDLGDAEFRVLEEVACLLEAPVAPTAGNAFLPRPVFRIDRRARILIVGQAPSRRLRESGIPWADASGSRLRAWLETSALGSIELTIAVGR